MNPKDIIIRKMSVKMRIPESTIETIISHQFKSMNSKMSSCNSIEMSGFGKFLFKDKIAEREILKYQKILDLLYQKEKTKTNEIKIKDIEEKIKNLKIKVYGFCKDISGVEESSISEGGDKGIPREA